MISLDKHQKEAINNIKDCLLNEDDKCIVQMWCGTGKSRIELSLLLEQELSIIVVPSIALITQFMNDYILKFKIKKNTLVVCSKNEIENDVDITYTTNKKDILSFLKKDGIILSTYQSLHLIYELILKHKIRINLAVFDEAHHVVGNEYQKSIFDGGGRTGGCSVDSSGLECRESEVPASRSCCERPVRSGSSAKANEPRTKTPDIAS